MIEERKPYWPWIAALLIGLPVVYVASFGPACWIVSRRSDHSLRNLPAIYWPVGWIISRTSWGYSLLGHYAEIGMDRGSRVGIFDEPPINARGEITGLIGRNR